MKRDWTSQTAILLIGGILVVINLIALNLFGRLDLTDDGVYSLSDASIRLVETLDDPVTITAFFTKDLPAPYSTNRRFLKDKLDDYRAYGGNNIQYKFVDPADDEELRAEAGRFRIPPVQIQVIESDNVQLKNAYMGVAIQYVDGREAIPVVQDLSTLEYDITSAIRRLTQDDLPTIGFLSGHGEPNPAQSMRSLMQGLSRNYQVQTVTVQDGGLTPRPEALLVIAPADTLPEAHLRALDTYLMEGGRMALLLNRVAANLQVGQASELNIGLGPLLSAYGAALTPNLIMDEQSSVVTMQRQEGFFTVNQQIDYPLFPVSTSFNNDNMMVNRLSDVMFYFVSSIDTAQAVPEGVTVEPLVFSSNQSGIQQGFFMLQPVQTTAKLSGGPYTLAAAYTGTFPSAFETGRQSLPTRLVVAGDGDFINESIVGPQPGNIAFGLNMVDWLVQDEALLAIRTKTVAPRSLRPTSEGTRPWIKYGNMIGPVLLVMLFGLARWRQRKKREIAVVKREIEDSR